MGYRRASGKPGGKAAPFVLLDDARDGGRALPPRRPAEIVETREPGEIAACLDLLRGAGRTPPASSPMRPATRSSRSSRRCAAAPPTRMPPLLWFGLFDHVEPVDAGALLPDPDGAWAGAAAAADRAGEHEAHGRGRSAHIEAGDIYQANITFPAEVRDGGQPGRPLRRDPAPGAGRPWRH